MDAFEEGGIGIAFGEGYPDLADGEADEGADLKAFDPEGMALGFGNGGAAKSDAAEGLKEGVGHR